MNKFVAILFLFITAFSFGQEEDVPFDKRLFSDRKADFDMAVKAIKDGDMYFYNGSSDDLAIALKYYLIAQDINPYSSMLNYKIGICYLYGNQKFRSLEYLKFAYKVNPEVDPSIKFYLAQAYQLAGEFETAITLYREYKDEIRQGDDVQRFYINKKISECLTGIELKANPVRVWIDNLGDSINTEYPEFSPVISADNRVLFFTARRPDSYGGKKDETGYHYEDIYYSQREYGGEWSEAQNIGEPINTESHDATVGLAPDGKSLITYKGINSKNGDVLITYEISDGVWEVPSSMGDNINTKHHESSATLSFDEKTLFFVSDQPGGFGQHDIYVSYWDEEKQEWGPPENLGSTINTEYEEKGVFFHPDNRTLYFSSDGHNNIGGLDIFKTVYDSESGTWSEPENIGWPINTPDDDIYFVVTGDERYAYYSSYREDGYGEKDIYKITFLGDKKDPLLASAELSELSIYPEKYASTPGLIGDMDIVEVKDTTDTDTTDTDTTDTDTTDTDTTDVVAIDTSDTDTTTTKPDIVDTFEPILVCMLSGTVKDCKTNRGISADLTVINTETNEKIADLETRADGTYSILLKPGVDYAVTVSGTGYTIDSGTLKTTKKDNNRVFEMNFDLCPPVVGESFTLRNIYFDFDKSDLREKSVEELDKLVQVMKNHPTMVIELGGHTDRRGSDEYNLFLSRKRAEIAKKYLVDHGIEASRIRVKGYGESQPEVSGAEINAMQSRDEKEAAHQRNRRTVVTIISQ